MSDLGLLVNNKGHTHMNGTTIFNNLSDQCGHWNGHTNFNLIPTIEVINHHHHHDFSSYVSRPVDKIIIELILNCI